MVSLTKKIKNVFVDVAQSSTIHAIPNIFRTKRNILKLIWTVAFLAFFGFFLFQTYTSVCDYLSHEVVTKITINYQTQIEFPAITICNSNPLTTDYSYDVVNQFLIKNDLLIKMNSSYFPNKYFINEKNNISYDLSLKLLLMKYYTLTNIFNNTNRTNFGQTIDQMLISCKISLEPCFSKDFDRFFHPYFGNCFKYSAKKYISRPGKMNALSIELFSGEVDDILSFGQVYGIHVFVDNISVPLSHDSGIDISTGMETNLIIDRLDVNKIEDPYSNCLNDLESFEYYKLITSYNQTYRQKDCFPICLQNFLLAECGCYDSNHLIENKKDHRMCLNLTELYCVFFKYRQFYSPDSKPYKNCTKYCPLECQFRYYGLKAFTNNYPTEVYAKALIEETNLTSRFKHKANLTFEKIKNSILSLNIYYDELKYTQIDEIIKTQLFDLISNIGGNVGLFIGASFLSLLEFLEFLIELLYTIHEHEHNRVFKTFPAKNDS